MTIKDKLGREIKVGSYIIYPSIGTMGEVLDTKTDDNGQSWVLIDVDELTRLWYNTKFVELTDKEYMKNRNTEDSDEESLSVDELKEKVDNHIDVTMDQDAVGGG